MTRMPLSIVSTGLSGLSAAILATLVACSSSGSGGPSASEAANEVASALCARIEACAPLYVQIAYGDVTTCTSRSATLLVDTLNAPGTGWTPSAVEACAKAIPGASCDDALGHDLPAACMSPAGQLQAGAACGDSSQCASSYCNLSDGGKCGTCASGLGPAGATCYRDDDCVRGTLCVGADLTAATTVAGHCTAPGASGAACGAAAPCQKTLACIGAVCTTAVAAGGTCVQTPDFFGGCGQVSGNYCSKATGGMCTKLGVAASGAACGLVNAVATTCSASGVCPTGTTTATTCVAPAADFGDCNTKAGPGCMSPATCIGGKCILPTPDSCK